MNSVVITTVVIPGFVSVLLFLVFTYLHEQSRQPYFRAWQLAWAAYCLHYVLDSFPSSPLAFFAGELFLVAMALCIFVSTRLMRGSYRFRWIDAAVGTGGAILAAVTFSEHFVHGAFDPGVQPAIQLGAGLAAVLIGFGLGVVYARRFVARLLNVEGRLATRWLPLMSSAVITIAGVAITVQALANGGIIRAVVRQ